MLDIGLIRAQGRRNLSESEVKAFLEQNGVTVTERVVLENEEVDIDIGFPLVIKVDSPDILHKTEVDGVVLNVTDGNVLMKEVSSMRKRFPGKRVLVERMEKGEFEVIVGLLNDNDFGLCIMFGIGGILTEVYKDVSFRKVPISKADAEEMIGGIRAAPLLKGFRGIEADREGVVDLMLRISDIGDRYGEHIDQLDLNPVLVKGVGNVTVDAKLVLRAP